MMLGDDSDNLSGQLDELGAVRPARVLPQCGGDTGTMSLIAREPGDSWDDSTACVQLPAAAARSLVAIRVDGDLTTDTYNVFVDGTRWPPACRHSQRKTGSRTSRSPACGGAGAFFADNVNMSNPARALVDGTFDASEDSDELRALAPGLTVCSRRRPITSGEGGGQRPDRARRGFTFHHLTVAVRARLQRDSLGEHQGGNRGRARSGALASSAPGHSSTIGTSATARRTRRPGTATHVCVVRQVPVEAHRDCRRRQLYRPGEIA